MVSMMPPQARLVAVVQQRCRAAARACVRAMETVWWPAIALEVAHWAMQPYRLICPARSSLRERARALT